MAALGPESQAFPNAAIINVNPEKLVLPAPMTAESALPFAETVTVKNQKTAHHAR